jgi:hypothetical protein
MPLARPQFYGGETMSSLAFLHRYRPRPLTLAPMVSTSRVLPLKHPGTEYQSLEHHTSLLMETLHIEPLES